MLSTTTPLRDIACRIVDLEFQDRARVADLGGAGDRRRGDDAARAPRRPVCAFPGCDRSHGLQAHHLTRWIHGGRTDLDNLALLCAAHHHLLHEGHFSARRRNGGLTFADARGHEIHALPSEAPPTVARVA